MFIPNPLLWHGVREYSAAANHNSRYHVRRPNERQTNERTKISFRHPHFKSAVLYQFFARNDKLQRARHTVAVARTLDVYSPHSDAAAIRYNSAETGGRAAMTTKLAFWNRAAVPRRMHLHRSAVGCAKP